MSVQALQDASDFLAKAPHDPFTFPNIREWNRAAPDAIVIRFAQDITNEHVATFSKALMAPYLRHAVGLVRVQFPRQPGGKGGYTIDTDYLSSICAQNRIGAGKSPSMSVVEEVLISVENCPLPATCLSQDTGFAQGWRAAIAAAATWVDRKGWEGTANALADDLCEPSQEGHATCNPQEADRG